MVIRILSALLIGVLVIENIANKSLSVEEKAEKWLFIITILLLSIVGRLT